MSNDSIMSSPQANTGNAVSRFLYFCAGADQKMLQACTNTDRVKFQGIGGTVLATAVLAFLSGSYAFYTVFSPKVANVMEDAQQVINQAMDTPAFAMSIIFGLVWALMIFNLDRFIVSTSGHGDGTEKITWGEFGRALPRICMAIMIGFVLSKPLEIRIMQSEIDAQMQLEQEKHINKRKVNLDDEYRASRKDLDNKSQELVVLRNNKGDELKKVKLKFDVAEKDYIEEMEGKSGSQTKGEGKIAREKRLTRDKAENEYQDAKSNLAPTIKSIQSEIDQAQKERESLIAKREERLNIIKLEAAQKDGLIERIHLAEQIAPIASLLLTILLIFLEISPILFKMMLQLSPYDYLMENEKQKTVAQRAIDIQPVGHSEQEKIYDVKHAKYYQADVIRIQETGKIQVEIELSQKAQEQFLAQIKDDISRDPSKYIRQEVMQEIVLPKTTS